MREIIHESEIDLLQQVLDSYYTGSDTKIKLNVIVLKLRDINKEIKERNL